MRIGAKWGFPVCVIVLGAVAACGTSVPHLQDITDRRETPLIINSIVSKANCELESAVQLAILNDIDIAEENKKHPSLPQGRHITWLDNWLADVILTITIDEKSGVAPGLTTNGLIQSNMATFHNGTTLNTAQSFNLGLGASISADATRKDTLEWIVDFSKFTDPQHLALARAARDKIRKANGGRIPEGTVVGCNPNGSLIEGNLQVADWLLGEVFESYSPDFNPDHDDITDYQKDLQAAAQSAKKGVLGHDVTFVLLYSGNITPSWKLLRVSINQGSTPLISGQRTKTQDLLFTLGPPAPPAVPPATAPAALPTPQPSQQVLNAALAGQIGISVANAIRNLQ